LAGYEGSAVAALLCYAGMTAMCYFLGQRNYPIPYGITKGILYIGVTIALVYTVLAIEIENQYMASAFHMAVIFIYLLVVYLIERKNLKVKQA
jgi:hypothetical protein